MTMLVSLITFIQNVFFSKMKNFFFHILKKKIDYVVICSPSYLHFKHIKLSISSGCNVIVEKPPILNLSDFKKIENLEKNLIKDAIASFNFEKIKE